MLRVKERGAVVAEIPNPALTDEAPVYDRPMAEPAYLADVHADSTSARRRCGATAPTGTANAVC